MARKLPSPFITQDLDGIANNWREFRYSLLLSELATDLPFAAFSLFFALTCRAIAFFLFSVGFSSRLGL
jgi:hypothetical protein